MDCRQTERTLNSVGINRTLTLYLWRSAKMSTEKKSVSAWHPAAGVLAVGLMTQAIITCLVLHTCVCLVVRRLHNFMHFTGTRNYYSGLRLCLWLNGYYSRVCHSPALRSSVVCPFPTDWITADQADLVKLGSAQLNLMLLHSTLVWQLPILSTKSTGWGSLVGTETYVGQATLWWWCA